MRLATLVKKQKREWEEEVEASSEERSPLSASSVGETEDEEADDEAAESFSADEDPDLLAGAKVFRSAEVALAMDNFEAKRVSLIPSGRFFTNIVSGKCHAERSGAELTSMCGISLVKFEEVEPREACSFSFCDRCSKTSLRD